MTYVPFIKGDTPKGWECPKCGLVMAPTIISCLHCAPHNHGPKFSDPLPDLKITNEITKKFITVSQIANYHSAFTPSSIRWLIFNEKTNGFSACIRRIGRKILIDLAEFEKWISGKI